MADIELLKRLAEAVREDNGFYGDPDCYAPNLGLTGVENEFAMAANPAAVLALIAENEALKQHNEFLAGAPERFAASLRAVADALGLGADRNVHADCVPAIAKLRAESERLREDVKDHADARAHYCGKVGEIAGERDQLKAELERVSAQAHVNFFNLQCRHEKLTSMQLQAELERMQEQKKSAGDADAAENCRCNEKVQVVQDLQVELERVRADAERLRKHLAECADSLESEILDRYGSSKDHPAMRRKFERDMQDVIDARAAMGKGGGANG